MSDRLPKHLHDALTAASLAVQFMGQADLAAYEANAMQRSAVERQFEILGEACRRALEDTPDLRADLPEAALAIGLRNRIIHSYDRVEHAVL